MLVQARFVSSVTEADKIIKSNGVSVNAVASGDEVAGYRAGAETRTRRLHRPRRKEVQAHNDLTMLLQQRQRGAEYRIFAGAQAAYGSDGRRADDGGCDADHRDDDRAGRKSLR